MSERETSSAPIGSWDWLQVTGGVLTPEERRSLVPALAGTFGQFAADRARLAFRARPKHGLGMDELWPVAPDSRFVQLADEEARALQSEPMVNHAFRTWVFGAALARIDGAALDPELFHSGALLHDAGIERTVPKQCFTWRSADAARAVAERAGLPLERARSVMDGIGMHITPGLTAEESAIGFYLQAGAMADFAGVRTWEIPPAVRARADETYPRQEIHKLVSRCWRADATAVPNGRADLAEKLSGFSKLVRWFPAAR